MTRIVKFPVTPPKKLGLRKVGRKKKLNLEDFGQLNLFDAASAKVINFPRAESFFEEALMLDQNGEEDAIQYYLKAIEAGEAKADAYCNLGIIMSEKSELSKAVDYLTKCLKEDPRHFEAHYNLANVYSDKGSYELAQMHYEIAIELEPEFPNSHYNLGLVLISMKQYTDAYKYINSYIELSPGYDHSVANDLLKTLNSIAQ